MKRLIKYALLLAVVGTAICGCTKVWEDEWVETIPLPETDIPIDPDPWEPPETDENPVGN